MRQVAYVDLTNRKVTIKPIPEDLLRMFLGGRGMGAYLLYNHSEKGIDPLNPENPLIFSAGFMSGQFANAMGRCHVTGKSPDTGHYGDSNIGGALGAEMMYAGFQHIVITGKAKTPTYLLVDNGQIQFRDASKLWGLDTYEVQLRLWDELQDPDVKIACIGEAGERKVGFACIRHQLKRAAGRTGQGAVMGSKNLKAVALRGSQSLPVKHPEKLLEITRRQYDYARRTKIFEITKRWSNLFAWVVNNEREGIVVRNHRANYFPEGYGHMDVDIFLEKYGDKMLACQQCAMHCQHRFSIKEGPFKGVTGEGPEWIAPVLFGAFAGNTEWDKALMCFEKTNRYGIDSLTYGLYQGWLMDIYDRGLLSKEATGGIDFNWGSAEAMAKLPELINKGEGIGKVISHGAEEAIKHLGPETGEFLYRCGRGLTQEPVNDRILRATCLGDQTSNRGNDHLRGRCNLEFMGLPADVLSKIIGRPTNPDPYAWDTKAFFAMWQQNLNTMSDCLGLCKFWTQWFAPDLFGYEQPLEVINAVTGWNMTKEELWTISERGWNMEKMFNVRDGEDRRHDTPPKIFFEPIKEGARKGLCLEPDKWNALLDEYYELRGWDKNGIPRPETLKRLKLDKEPSHIL
ncbi:MAG: aldehyde ferredoxin oxidoreductase family protein [Dehalococcoidia bacterium]|nr:aldehyde ferredoxin oxidoreductase family protein [Dehalococcoidia bacterium]